jgi:hypothetical protein
MIFNALRVPLRTTVPTLLRRNAATTTFKSPLLAAKPELHLRHKPIFFIPNQIAARTVASQVSGRPASQTIEHAAENIREEVGNSAADLARTIAGGNYFDDSVKPPSKETFVSALIVEVAPQKFILTLQLLAGHYQ